MNIGFVLKNLQQYELQSQQPKQRLQLRLQPKQRLQSKQRQQQIKQLSLNNVIMSIVVTLINVVNQMKDVLESILKGFTI